MVLYCLVKGCKNAQPRRGRESQNAVELQPELKFHGFPKDFQLKVAWLKNCRIIKEGKDVGREARVCSAHFLPSDYERDLQNELLGLPIRRRLKASAVPSVFPFDTKKNNKGPYKLERGLRLERRKLKQEIREILNEPKIISVSDEEDEIKKEEPETVTEDHKKCGLRCLICKSEVRNQEKYSAVDKREIEEQRILLDKFCLALKLILPLKCRKWDFAQEPFPFCRSCQEEIVKLCSLVDQLKSIESEINRSVNCISTLLLTSESLVAGRPYGPGDFPQDMNEVLLQEKHQVFRRAIIERYDPQVCVQRCHKYSESSSPAPKDSMPLPKRVPARVDQNSQGICQPISIASDIFENDSLSPELDPPDEPTLVCLPAAYESPTKAPKKGKYCSVKLIDPTTKTYELGGFKFQERENGYECLTCKKMYSFRPRKAVHPWSRRRENITVHIQKTHLRKKSGTCEICNKEYANVTLHKRSFHFVTDSDRRLCDICGKEFKTFNHLASHRYMVHRMLNPALTRRFPCDQCGKAYAFKHLLTLHYRVHTKEKPYMCEQCGKGFTRWPSWKSHLDGVHGEKKFSCDRCGVAFRRNQSLQMHIKRIHEGIKYPKKKKSKERVKDSCALSALGT